MTSRTRKRSIAVVVGTLVLALLAGCTSEPTPVKEPVPTVAYPPLPAFAASPSDIPNPDPVTETMSAGALVSDLDVETGQLDLDGLLNVSQGGYHLMRNPHWFADQAAQMSSMGINQVRIDQVLDDDTFHAIRVDAAGKITYDFTELDKVVLPLIDHGLTPFMILSYMPRALGPSYIGPPKSLAAWQAAVEALVSHYAALGHTGWSWEVWNEIDSPKWSGTLEQYGEMFAASVNGVRAADPTAKVGGSAASEAGVEGGWSDRFIKYLGAHPEIEPDFFSVHAYRSSDFANMAIVRNWLTAAGRADVPIFITEWNNVSQMAEGAGLGSDSNASPNGSSYIARRLFLGIDSGASQFFYFTPVEGFNPQVAYGGDLGLVTVDGHRKAAGNVFEAYSRLETTIVSSRASGKGAESRSISGFVTKNDATSESTVMLWNTTTSDAVMSVKLDGLPYADRDSQFSVSKRVIATTSGNGFADGALDVSNMYPSPNESLPVVSKTAYKAAATFAGNVTVPANGVVTLTIAPTTHEPGTMFVSAQPSQINVAATSAGGIANATSTIEKPDQGWGIAGLTDGRRYSVETGKLLVRGWSSEPTTDPAIPQSVAVDFGKPTTIDTVVLWPRNSENHDGTGFPKDFTIDASLDGQTWTTVYSVADYKADSPVSGSQSFSFEPGLYQHLRVTATKLGNAAADSPTSFSFQLGELEAYRNGIPNSSFENGELAPWSSTSATVSIDPTITHSGAGALLLGSKGDSVHYEIQGLVADQTYTFGGYVRASDTDTEVVFSAKDAEGTVTSTSSSDGKWTAMWVTFTTGLRSTSATLSVELAAGSGSAVADDFVLTQKPVTQPEG